MFTILLNSKAGVPCLLMLLVMSSCRPAQVLTSEVTLYGGTRDELQLTSKGFGKDEYAAKLDAFKRAVDAVLYRGFVAEGSPVKDPLIKDKELVQQAHDQFFNALYSDGTLHEIVLSYMATGKARKEHNLYESTYHLRLNLRLLRSRLEDAGIVRKFGI